MIDIRTWVHLNVKRIKERICCEEQPNKMDSFSEESEQSENELMTLVELEQQHERIESENIASLSAQSKLFSPCQCILRRCIYTVREVIIKNCMRLAMALNTARAKHERYFGEFRQTQVQFFINTSRTSVISY